MDHIEAIAELTPEQKQELTATDTSKGLIHLGLYGAALMFTSLWIGFQLPYWGLFLVPHGILISFLFTLSHECTHHTPFGPKWLNNAVGHVVSLPLCLPFIWFRYFHLAHHKYTNDPENDPELAGEGRPDTWRSYLIYLTGWDYWSGNMSTIWRNAFGKFDAPYLPVRQYPKMRKEARIMLVLYGLIIASLLFSSLALWLWIIPALIGQPFLRLYLLAEHGHCPPVANMLENTRTTFTSRLVRFVAWNMPYHAEHHSFPSVPFHKLPLLHKALAPHLLSTSASYTGFTKQYIKDLGN